MFAAMNGETCSCIPGSRVDELNARKGAESPGRNNPVQIPLERANELAPEERLRGLDDLHGVSTATPECPERILSQLDELEMEMIHLREPKGAYEQAKAMDFDYVQSLRLPFLRVASFDVAEAARRLAYHFECRQKYFGSDKLVGDLTYADLSPEDLSYYNTGFAQLLPDCDRSGRAIIVVFGRQSCVTPIETLIRLHFIFAGIATQDENIQRKGAIYIYFGYGQSHYTTPRMVALLQTMRGTQLRSAAVHLCYDNPILHSLVTIVAFTLPSQALIRFKCHFGSVLECLYSLRAFGVPSGAIPIHLDGSWEMVCSGTSRSSSPQTENSSICSKSPMDICVSPGSPVFLEPQAMDVLMGRGKGGMKSLGNQRLKMLQEEYRERYETANRRKKIAIAQTIFDAMIDSGSRFLSQTDDRRWTIVNDSAAKKSISHGFRNMRRVERARMNL